MLLGIWELMEALGSAPQPLTGAKSLGASCGFADDWLITDSLEESEYEAREARHVRPRDTGATRSKRSGRTNVLVSVLHSDFGCAMCAVIPSVVYIDTQFGPAKY